MVYLRLVRRLSVLSLEVGLAARGLLGALSAVGSRRTLGRGAPDRGLVPAFTAFFTSQVAPVLSQTGAAPLAWLRTEYAENTFPALPVRTGENVFVWFSRFADSAGLGAHRDALAHSRRWHTTVRPALLTMLTGEPQQLTLAPTPRSLLR